MLFVCLFVLLNQNPDQVKLERDLENIQHNCTNLIVIGESLFCFVFLCFCFSLFSWFHDSPWRIDKFIIIVLSRAVL